MGKIVNTQSCALGCFILSGRDLLLTVILPNGDTAVREPGVRRDRLDMMEITLSASTGDIACNEEVCFGDGLGGRVFRKTIEAKRMKWVGGLVTCGAGF